jgi:UDP-3-O-[3-hydroxymyristoyl] glucosamine N-acyltransferase
MIGGMSEPVFHHRGTGLAVRDIVELTSARAAMPVPDRQISDVAALDRAGPHDATFVDRAGAERQLQLTQAGVCFVSAGLASNVGPQTLALIVEYPYRAFVRVATALYPDAARPSSLFDLQGRAPSALVHPTARVETGVTIDPMAVVGPGAEIGAGSVIGPMAVIGPRVRIGRDCSIEAGVSLTNALVGDRVSLGAGCRIGPARVEQVQGRLDATPVLGRAILQDKVAVGSNSTVERGFNRDTILGEGTIVDPLVCIPADAVIGRYCRIAAVDRVKAPAGIDLDTMSLDGIELVASQLNCAELSYSQR